MDGSEDENEGKTEETPTETSKSTNNDQNNVIIVVQNEQNAQISADLTMEMNSQPKATDSSASKCLILNKKLKNVQCPTMDESNELPLEVNLIVVDEKKTTQTMKSNENGQTSSKRLRLEIEPLTNQTDKSSQNTQIPPDPLRSELAQPRKSIEELVSSSEAFDTNNEDKYFALSILGTLRRLTPHKRALAKCHILSYLTEIEYGNSNSTT